MGTSPRDIRVLEISVYEKHLAEPGKQKNYVKTVYFLMSNMLQIARCSDSVSEFKKRAYPQLNVDIILRCSSFSKILRCEKSMYPGIEALWN